MSPSTVSRTKFAQPNAKGKNTIPTGMRNFAATIATMARTFTRRSVGARSGAPARWVGTRREYGRRP
jgi:hypothetical protein